MASREEVQYDDDEQGQIIIPSSSSSSSRSRIATGYGTTTNCHKNEDVMRKIRRVIGATAAGVAVGGPLLVGMGVTLAVSLSVAVIGVPLMVVFSPLLVIPCFILVAATAAFSLAALMALAGLSTFNWVFRSFRRRPKDHFSYVGDKAAADDEEEEDAAANTLAKGWKRQEELRIHQHQHQHQENKRAANKEQEEEAEAGREDDDEDDKKESDDVTLAAAAPPPPPDQTRKHPSQTETQTETEAPPCPPTSSTTTERKEAAAAQKSKKQKISKKK